MSNILFCTLILLVCMLLAIAIVDSAIVIVDVVHMNTLQKRNERQRQMIEVPVIAPSTHFHEERK